MGTKNADGAVLRTTKISLDVVQALKELDGARVTELANYLDLAPSTIHNHLSTLRNEEYVVKDGDFYRLGLQFLTLGEYVRNCSEAYLMAKSKVAELAEATGGRAHFVVEENGRGVYLYTSTGEDAFKAYSGVGKRVHLHVAAAGKAILANLPEWTVNDILDKWGLPRETENTITDREVLFEELEGVRDRGYSYNREEHLNGINAVGAPVVGADGQVIGAFSISGPAHRLADDQTEEDFVNAVLDKSNEMELNLAYS